MKNKLSSISFALLITALIGLCLGFALHIEVLALVSGLSIIGFTGLNVLVNSFNLLKS